MASMFDHRDEYAQNAGKCNFARASTYQDNMKSSTCMGYSCNPAGGSCDRSAKSRSDGMFANYGSFHGGSLGLATTRSNDSTGANGFGAAGIDYINHSVERYPSPVRHSMSRKVRLVSHWQQPEPDSEFRSRTPLYDQAFPSFGRF